MTQIKKPYVESYLMKTLLGYGFSIIKKLKNLKERKIKKKYILLQNIKHLNISII